MICDFPQTLGMQRITLSRDDPDDWTWVRWYWAQPLALPLGIWQAYGHPIYDSDQGQEYADPQTYLAGGIYAPSRISPFPGQHHHGLDEWFLTGLPPDVRADEDSPEGAAGPQCGVELWQSCVAFTMSAADEAGVVGVGGAAQGGTAAQGTGGQQVGYGGQAQGGTAAQGAAAEQTGQGGQAQGGTAVQTGQAEQTGAGGQAQGGAALQGAGAEQTGQGGQAQGGQAAQTGQAEQTGAGGQAQGGTAVQSGQAEQTGAGGQAQGGAALQGGGAAGAGAGGQAQGGTALQGGGAAGTGAGGQAQGGEALTEYDEMAIPPATIIAWAGNGAVPAGWLVCNGQTVSQTTYPALYAAIGTTYGPAAGGNFTLPDLHGRWPIHAGGAVSSTIGVTGGAATHTLTTGQLPAHAHNFLASGGNVRMQDLTSTTGTFTPAVAAGSRLQYDKNATENAGGGGAVNHMPPYLVMTFLIKT